MSCLATSQAKEVVMAATVTVLAEARQIHRLSIARLFVAGGVTASVIFVLCWLGTFIPFSSPTHAYISLFTPADIASVTALIEGTVWSLLFGALSGALFALIYNATAPLVRR
jgi:hypothetical protein